jgi:TIR domain
MSARPQKAPVRIVLSYAHRDEGRLERFGLIPFLEGLPKKQNWEFWSDKFLDDSRFDEEIKARFNRADVIVCIVSQYFLNSKYINEVEKVIARRRSKNERILVVPILLTPSFWEEEKWLTKLHHFPKRKGYVFDEGVNRLALAMEIARFIIRHFEQRVLPFRDPKLLYKMRRLARTSLTEEQTGILRRDACERASEAVPNPELRAKICREAKRLIKQKGVDHLSKKDLAALDKKSLANGRKPDPEIVRWVLRCAGLHPQGKAGA